MKETIRVVKIQREEEKKMCCSLFFGRDGSEGEGLAKDSESIQFDSIRFLFSIPSKESFPSEYGIFHGVKD